MFRAPTPPPLSADESPVPKKTIIVALGLLQKLDYMRTIKEFIRLSKDPTNGEEIEATERNISQKMDQISKWDKEFKAGRCKIEDFRSVVLNILGLKLSPEIFDHTWCQMLGDAKEIKVALEILKKKYNVILVSKTNPIHYGRIQSILQPEEKSNIGAKEQQPRKLLGIPMYLSYESPTYQKNADEDETAFYREVILKEKLNLTHTAIVLQLINSIPTTAGAGPVKLKNRDEISANQIQKWSKENGIHIIEYQYGQDIIRTIDVGMQKLEVSEPTPLLSIGMS